MDGLGRCPDEPTLDATSPMSPTSGDMPDTQEFLKKFYDSEGACCMGIPRSMPWYYCIHLNPSEQDKSTKKVPPQTNGLPNLVHYILPANNAYGFARLTESVRLQTGAFLYIDVGSFGKESLRRSIKLFDFRKKTTRKIKFTPSWKSGRPLNYVFISNEVCGISTNLMRAYAGSTLIVPKREGIENFQGTPAGMRIADRLWGKDFLSMKYSTPGTLWTSTSTLVTLSGSKVTSSARMTLHRPPSSSSVMFAKNSSMLGLVVRYIRPPLTTIVTPGVLRVACPKCSSI
nr:unnamed protein product [Callosobruchus analis]